MGAVVSSMPVANKSREIFKLPGGGGGLVPCLLQCKQGMFKLTGRWGGGVSSMPAATKAGNVQIEQIEGGG